MKKRILNLFIIFVILIGTFFVSMSVSYNIPNTRIKWHVAESVEQFKQEGIYPRLFFGTPAAQLDNFTDSWMFNIALSADNDHPIKSSQANYYMSSDGDKIEMLEKAVNNPQDTKAESYSRYWHGYLAFLRPLLVFLSYIEIRFLNMCILSTLFVVVNMLLKKRLGTKIMLSFLLSMMTSMFIIVPMSIQFSSMFYVMFIAMIVILLFYEKIDKENLSPYLFFVVGSVASFLDLLTAPIITIGLPMATYILLRKNKYILENLIEVVKGSILWALGYGLTWASKWVIASIVLKENVVKNALDQILVRTSDQSADKVITAMDVIELNKNMILDGIVPKIFMLILIAWIIGMIFFGSLEKLLNATPLLLIACMPLVWYVVLKNHSSIHYWFTYRALSVTVFSVLAFMAHGIDKNKVLSKIGGIRWSI